jgi:hypothetical protein
MVGLVAVSLLATLSESGVIVPSFHSSGSGGGSGIVRGGTTSTTATNLIENVSFRSWTVTGIRLAHTGSPPHLSDVMILGLHLELVNDSSDGNALGPPVRRLRVGPGQGFDAVLTEKQDHCPSLPLPLTVAQIDYYRNNPIHPRTIPAVYTVATPLGTRTIATTFTVSCTL